jgi:hypothetical protein
MVRLNSSTRQKEAMPTRRERMQHATTAARATQQRIDSTSWPTLRAVVVSGRTL